MNGKVITNILMLTANSRDFIKILQRDFEREIYRRNDHEQST